MLKQRLNTFLNRPTYYDRVFTGCMLTFVGTLLFVVFGLMAAVGGWENLIQTAKFAEILAVVEHTYIGEADAKQAADAGFSAMVASLEDRWSYYMNAEAYERYQEHSANRYTGIGVTLYTKEDGSLVIEDVAENSPAEAAGMTVGLTLKAVNGESIQGKTVQEVSAEIQAIEGEFTILAEDAQGKEVSFTLSLGKVFSDPISYEMLEGGIGYIKIKNFDDGCADGVLYALDELLGQDVKGLIFDVRNNGGGYVSELTKVLDALLPEGEIFISVNDRGTEKITTSDAACIDLPMVVLVNASSYSAAEYFAVVLREYDAAVIVGQATTGKGRSQINVPLIDGSAVHISSKRYLTPDRVDLSEVGGLVPDVALELGENDEQLLAAMELFS